MTPYTATIGVLGGGQLAGMLSAAAAPLGIRLIHFAPYHAPAAGLTDTMTAEFTDEAALRALADQVDVVTYESENVPVSAVDLIVSAGVRVHPPGDALANAGDRWREKELFTRLDIPTAPFARIAQSSDLADAAAAIGLPAVLKTRRFGYDGRGQAVARSEPELSSAWSDFDGVPLLYEQWVPFDREVSLVGVRSAAGDVRFYDVGENVHREGMLHSTIVPASDWTPALEGQAQTYVRSIMESLDYVGVLALEMFQTGDRLVANEIAPRVHNTGHWTIDGAVTSQFENHVRAVLGWPLGSTARRGCAAMLNIVGSVPDVRALLQVPDAHVHLYGKEPRPRRKLGHVTVCADSPARARELLAKCELLTGQVAPEPS